MQIHDAIHTPIPPSEQTLIAIRAGFVGLGESLHAWCRERGYHHQNVRLALLGTWEGPRAQEVRAEIVDYLRERGVSL